MSLLVETIKAENGRLLNISFHNERLNRTLLNLFSISKEIDLRNVINIPETVKSGVFKCRVEYDQEIRKIEFIPYSRKVIKTLKVVEDNNIDYSYKYTDRTALSRLMDLRGECDDILIIRDGNITDTSFCNVVFGDKDGARVTPVSCLLKGTMRASLLKSGSVRAVPLREEDMYHFTYIKLINSMIGIEDTEWIPIENVKR